MLVGAAMYALAPDAIYARRSRHAYGVQTTTFFKKGHRLELRFTEPTTNKILCSKVFSPLVKLDELVEHDQVTFNPYHVSGSSINSGFGISEYKVPV